MTTLFQLKAACAMLGHLTERPFPDCSNMHAATHQGVCEWSVHTPCNIYVYIHMLAYIWITSYDWPKYLSIGKSFRVKEITLEWQKIKLCSEIIVLRMALLKRCQSRTTKSCAAATLIKRWIPAERDINVIASSST